MPNRRIVGVVALLEFAPDLICKADATELHQDSGSELKDHCECPDPHVQFDLGTGLETVDSLLGVDLEDELFTLVVSSLHKREKATRLAAWRHILRHELLGFNLNINYKLQRDDSEVLSWIFGVLEVEFVQIQHEVLRLPKLGEHNSHRLRLLL